MVTSAGCRGKEPDVGRGEAGPDVPFVVLCPTVVGLGGLIVKEVIRHWHLLAICLEPDGVTAGSNKAVDEHGCRQVDVPLAGLEVESTGLSNVILVELFEEGLLVTEGNPELMCRLGQQEVPVEGWSPVVGGVKLPHWCPADQLDVGQ
jgi:hypothetical protein